MIGEMQQTRRESAPLLLAAATTGTVASLLTTAGLAAMAAAEGKSPLQPTNATSHWLHGQEAGRVEGADLAHTGIGFATHHASALFWALPFEMWLASRPERSAGAILRDAAVMAGIAAVVDYGLVPRRLTPGWEHALPTRSIAATFGLLALGLAGGALLTRAIRDRA